MDTDERGQTLRENAGFCGRRAGAMREPFIPGPGVRRAGLLGSASNSKQMTATHFTFQPQMSYDEL